MPNTPLNPDALSDTARVALINSARELGQEHWCLSVPAQAKRVLNECADALAVAQPEVNSFDPRVLNRKGWTCGCEPGNYDSCDECQSACNELANFLNRPEVKP